MFESTLSSPDGNILGHLRGRMPKLAGAEEKAKAEQAWELIYNDGTTLKGNHPPPKPWPGHLALLSLDTPSLTPPCYNDMSKQRGSDVER